MPYTLSITRDAHHGGEYRITNPGEGNIDGLNSHGWYFCERGAYIYPGRTRQFFADAAAQGYEIDLF